jgi:ATP-dependent DNA helicase RecG
MTATPIPRSISLTLMGNLDLSLIKQKPKNRLPVKTFLVPGAKTEDCYQWIREQIKKTHQQAFIVCPFIEASETLSSVKSAKDEFDHLSKNIFPDLKLALIHGKIKSVARQKIISDFHQNKINILVTTPIIEVGIDIPNATIIIIQSADRFGLAQLHQLRGRVGRDQDQSYCYFFTPSQNQNALDRLKFLQTHHDGLAIAKYDLDNRGPGEVFSTLQHGFPSLKLASLEDEQIIKTGLSILKLLVKNSPKTKLNQFIDRI